MKLFQKNELKFLLPFYVEVFISHLFYFVPAFWVLQLQQTLTFTQIGILFGVLSISMFIFEIPTGAFADIYGRKKSTLLGYFLTSLICIFLFFYHNFYGILFIFILWGFAHTFISGAKEAWVVDRLKYNRQNSLIKEFYIKEQSIIRLSLFLSGILGAFAVARFGLNIIWIFAALSYLITGIILCFITENIVSKDEKQSFKKLFSQAKKSIKFSLNHQILLLIFIAAFFIMFKVSFSEDLVWQPFLKQLNYPVYALGFLFSSAALIGAFVPFVIKPILSKFNHEKNYLSFLIGISIVFNVLIIFVNNFVFAIILFLLLMISIDLFMPINSDYIQRHIPNKMRATVISFYGMVVSFAIGISSPIAGIIADNVGPKYTLVIGSVFLIPALILYLKIKDKKK